MKKSYLFSSFILFFVGFGLQAQNLNDPDLIDITTLAQLDAMRYDLDGDGVPTTAGLTAYNAAFGTTVPRGDTNDADDTVPQATFMRGYELMNDLDFSGSAWAEGGAISGGWVPIGDNSLIYPSATATDAPRHRFTATFEGHRHRISNLYINTSSIIFVGLFGAIGGSGKEIFDGPSDQFGFISNLGLEGGSVESTVSSFIGCLVGYSFGGSISACYATGDVTGGDNAYVGGLVGENNNGSLISACYATGDVTGGEHAYVGGLVGESNVSTISACYATGNARGGDNAYAGGLVGFNYGWIVACYATGNVEVTNYTSVGGLVGFNYGWISACYATGDARGGDDVSVGGLAGRNNGLIDTCYSAGNARGGDDADVGGLVGYSGPLGFNTGNEISACYSTGDARGGDDAFVGGLVGYNTGSTISACYSIGYARGGDDAFVGGLLGYNNFDGRAIASYFNSKTSGLSDGIGGSRGLAFPAAPATALAKTTTQLQYPTSYTAATAAVPGDTAIYSAWNIDIDNNDDDDDLSTGIDDPWDFGTDKRYPKLKLDFDGDGSAPTAAEFGVQRFYFTKNDDVEVFSFSVAEGTTSGTIGHAKALSASPTFTLLDNNNFQIADGSTGMISVKGTADLDAYDKEKNSFVLIISATVESLTTYLKLNIKVTGSGNTALGLADEKPNGFGVYPNPASDRVYVSGLESRDGYIYELHSLLGQKVAAGQLSEDHRIELEDLSAGLYLLVLRRESGEEVFRGRCLISK